MTVDEAKQAHMRELVVVYNGFNYFIDHIITRHHKTEKRWVNELYLIPCNGINSSTVAKLRECELIKEQ